MFLLVMRNMPICVAPSNSGWLLSYEEKSPNSHELKYIMITRKHNTTVYSKCRMNRIVLVGFLPCDNGRGCDLHRFGCGNSLVINWADHGVRSLSCLIFGRSRQQLIESSCNFLILCFMI